MTKLKTICLFIAVAAAAFCADPAKKLTASEVQGVVIERVQPEYPPLARQLKVSGAVELEAVLSESGAVEKVNVVSGNMILTKAGVDALMKWKFRPVLADGKPVKALAPVQFKFAN